MKKPKLLDIILTFFIYLNHFKKIKTELTSWEDQKTGTFYDWSSLERNKDNPYIIKDAEIDEENYSIKYYFNFGKSLNEKCKDKEASIIEVLEYEGKNTNICEILGTSESFNIHMIDYDNPKKGIILEYGNGDICKTSQNEQLMGYPRKTIFKIYCSKKDENNFVLDFPERKQGNTKCVMEFKILSSAGCPIIFSSKIKSSNILCLTLILLGLYFFFGYIYNKYKYKSEGKAAIPNYIFWRQFPLLIIEGIFYIKDNMFIILNKLFNKDKTK
jgi:centromeric protein E